MTESKVEIAERLAGKRALLLIALAAVLIGTEVLGLEDVERPARLAAWVILVVLTALNLLPVGGWLKDRGVVRLLNDETTREHRKAGFTTGFWAALASGLIITVVDLYVPLSGAVAARVIVTAALSAALIGFAVRERQAAA